jgi:hypothetical protein
VVDDEEDLSVAAGVRSIVREGLMLLVDAELSTVGNDRTRRAG